MQERRRQQREAYEEIKRKEEEQRKIKAQQVSGQRQLAMYLSLLAAA